MVSNSLHIVEDDSNKKIRITKQIVKPGLSAQWFTASLLLAQFELYCFQWAPIDKLVGLCYSVVLCRLGSIVCGHI